MTTTIILTLYVCLIIHGGEILPVQKERTSSSNYQTHPHQMMYGMRSSIFYPRKSRVIPRDIQLLSRSERYWMAFCLCSEHEDVNGKRCDPKNMVLVLPIIVGFSNGLRWMEVFQKLWVRLLKIYYDIQGIDWKWQSLDSSVSIKAPLGGGG
jgi:hypothetical protein